MALLLRADGFDHFRCDRNVSLGINLANMGKVLKCCNNDDIVTLKADDQADVSCRPVPARGRSTSAGDALALALVLAADPWRGPRKRSPLTRCHAFVALFARP